MLSLWDALCVPSTSVPIDVTSLLLYVFPPIACYFVVAALAVTPGTRTARVALWPVVVFLALRAVVSVDMSLDKPWKKAFNASLVYYMFCIATRTFDWTLAKEPLVRQLRPANTTPSTIMDVLDLATNLRGVGWNWSHGMYIPRETRPADRMTFVLCTFVSAAGHAFVCGVLHRAILSFPGVGSITDGPTILDETLPFLLRYFRASIISTFTGIVAYASMQMGYDLCTIPAILLLGQDPAQWPPAFDAPWCATSLIDYWGHRWHQWNRHALLLLGGYPLSIFLGRAGMVLGTFLASGVMHDMVLLSLDSRTEFWRMLVGFGMMGPGMLAERAFYHSTGRRVGGVVGWVWMMTWLVLSGNVMTEGVARLGGLGDWTLIDSVLPMRVLVERSVMGFDVWLHAIQ